jgi:hypothetical protein
MNLSNFQKLVLYPKSLLLAFVGFAFFAIACYPGFMSPDSFQQYEQAHTLKFRDVHAPVMTWLWSKLILIWNGPQSLLFLHLGILWAGLYIWRSNAGENRKAIWFILLGGSPWVANFEGVLWKDMSMAFSLLLALGLLSKTRLTPIRAFAAISLLLYAFMVRTNAPAALIPIIWYASGRLFPLLSYRIKIAITMILLASMFAFFNFFNYHLLRAEKINVTEYVMVDDLVNISVAIDKNLFPRVEFETVKECSQAVLGSGKLVGRGFCLDPKHAPIPHEEIKEAWISAIKNYPVEYVEFRLTAYLHLLRSPSERPYFYWYDGGQEMGLTPPNNSATTILKYYVIGIAYIAPFLFKPYWWLIVALLFAGATFAMRGNRDSLILIRVLLASAILYMLSYIPVTVMADFRYVYWSLLAISLAALTFITSNLKIEIALVSQIVEKVATLRNRLCK